MESNNAFSIGLQIWLIFLVLFFLMRYPVPISVLLGGIIGLFGGVIRYFVQPENQTLPQERKDTGFNQFGNRLLQRFRHNREENQGDVPAVQVMRKRLNKPIRKRR